MGTSNKGDYMMFYLYDQNNSGGSFITDSSVCEFVFIEAMDADQANSRAEDIGIYFNGVDLGEDCDCCGDRWYPVSESDAIESPEVYGQSLVKAPTSFFRTQAYVYADDKTKTVYTFK